METTLSAQEESNKDQLFKKLTSTGLSIKQKLDLTVKKYDNKFFLDIDLDDAEVFMDIEDIIKPLQKVTIDLLKSKDGVARGVQALNKKLSWVIHHINETFCNEFRVKYENNSFTSVNAAESLAAFIYRTTCPVYQKGKSTLTKIDGHKLIKKRMNQFNKQIKLA